MNRARLAMLCFGLALSGWGMAACFWPVVWPMAEGTSAWLRLAMVVPSLAIGLPLMLGGFFSSEEEVDDVPRLVFTSIAPRAATLFLSCLVVSVWMTGQLPFGLWVALGLGQVRDLIVHARRLRAS